MPFAMSAKDQTTGRVATEPTMTATTQRTRYGRMAFGPKRYSAAFSP